MTYTIKSRVWIEVNNKMFLGEGRIQLLKTIQETKSLSKSAKKMGMSYKKAWKLLNSINKNAEKPVVISVSGGTNGGGTVVTAYGEELISKYDTLNKKCWQFLDKQLSIFLTSNKI